ncbi:MAG: hypothetical protein Ta2E_11820 [Mycoplasmoidaceae bacterium]|nr:MAG: hypothetical protein Ta2E_11820 [Mycoplasmoidaceae bacterium]
MAFHMQEKSKAICAQPYLTNFRLISDDTGSETYPGDGIDMRTYNDELQYVILLDALYYKNNFVFGLPTDNIHRFR